MTETTFTLAQAMLATMPFGIGVTQLIGDEEGRKHFTALTAIFAKLPNVEVA
jgi:hypothetical protein